MKYIHAFNSVLNIGFNFYFTVSKIGNKIRRMLELVTLLGAVALLSACGGDPIADAGPDQTIDEQVQVMLDGSASSDEDGSIVSYSWSQTAGTAVSLSDEAIESPTFTAPTTTVDESLSFELTVVDDEGKDAIDSVVINVTDLAFVVMNRMPAAAATNISRTVVLSAQFSETLLASSIDDTSFTLEDSSGFIPATISVEGNTVTLTPSAPLLRLTSYTARLSSDISSDLANALGTEVSWSFITEDKTWGGAVKIETGEEDANYPKIGFDSEGSASAVSESYLGVWVNHFSQSDGWDSGHMIDRKSGGLILSENSSRIAVDSDGNAFVAWVETEQLNIWDIWITRFSGDQWEDAFRIESIGGNAQIGIKESGDALVTWARWRDDGLDSEIRSVDYTVGVGWDNWQTVLMAETNDEAFSGTKLASDGAGNFMALWARNAWVEGEYDIWTAYYKEIGGWGAAVKINPEDLGYAGSGQVAFDNQGNALAVWRQGKQGSSGIIHYDIWVNRFNGVSWEGAQLIEFDDVGEATHPQIAFEGNGNALAVWEQYDGSRYNIIANHYRAETNSWDIAQPIETDDLGDANNPQIAIDHNGDGLVVWEQDDGSQFNIMAKRYFVVDGDEFWGDAVVLSDENIGNAGDARIAFDESGKAMAIWSQDDGEKKSIFANRFE